MALTTVNNAKSANYKKYLAAQKKRQSEYVTTYNADSDIEMYDPVEMLATATFERTPKKLKPIFKLDDGGVVFLSQSVEKRFDAGEDITVDTIISLKDTGDGMILLLQGTAGSGGGATALKNPFA